jgi:WD40 repeat protein/serine/threonine protein kinase
MLSPEAGSAGQTLLDADASTSESNRTLLEPQPAPSPSIEVPLEPSAVRSLAESDVPAEWQPGDELLDTYTVSGLLGEGGMGKVYRVHHKSWNIDLAVKSPRREFFQTPEQRELFIAEAETWVNLGLHPHIVSCYYVRNLGGIPRVFAELVEGGSLEDWIRQGRITTVEQALDIAIQFAWGLAYAHEQGLVHRDVKPANALMTPDGTVKVTDFGLAKAGKGLTPAYASPEQAETQVNQVELTPQADIWSWALSVLEMFAGRAFWVRADMPDYAWGQVAPQALEHYISGGLEDAVIPQIPAGLVQLLRECFQKNSTDRPASMDEAAERLVDIYQVEIHQPYPRQKPKAAELRADSLNNKALSLLDLGQPEEAARIWQQALAVDPFHPYAIYNSFLMRWRQAEIDDMTVVDELKKISGQTARRLLSLIHLERDDLRSATEIFEELSPRVQEDGDVEAGLSFARQRMECSTRLLDEIEVSKYTVNAISLSGDERQILTGSLLDPMARLWDVDQKRQRGAFEHGSGIGAVFLSPDGKLALTGGENRMVKLWDVDAARLLHTFQGHSERITAVRLSPDKRLAISSSYDRTVKIWDTASGQMLKSLDGHARAVTDVDLSQDGRTALSASFDRTIKVWEIPSGNWTMDCCGHTSFVDALSTSPNGMHALSGSGNAEVKLWDLRTGVCLRDFRGSTKSIKSAAISGSGKLALTGDIGGTLKLWELNSGRCLRTLVSGKGQQFDILWGNDDSRAFAAVYDHVIQIWQIGKPEEYYSAPYMLTKAVTGESALIQRQLFFQIWDQYQKAVHERDYCLAARELRNARSLPGYENDPEIIQAWGALYTHLPKKSFRFGWIVNAFTGERGFPRGVVLTKDGQYALCGSDSYGLKYYETRTGRLLYEYPDARSVHSVCLTPDERNAISGGVGTVQGWEISTGRCLIRGDTGTAVHALCLSADARFLLSSARDIQYWDLEAKRCITTIHVPLGSSINSMSLSPDERTFLTGHHNKMLIFWDLISAKPIWQIIAHDHIINCVVISPDGRLALSGSVDQRLKLWDLSTGKCLTVFSGHQNGIDSVRFSPDSRFAVSCSRDHTIKVWELSSGQCVYTLLGHANPVSAIDLSADGRYLFSAGWGGEMKLWELDWELDEMKTQDWDAEAAPYVNQFLRLHTPYYVTPSSPREVPSAAAAAALIRRGMPTWSEEDFQRLLHTLGCAGYGWLRPEGVRRKLEEMALERS